jgi:hypothetical protein
LLLDKAKFAPSFAGDVETEKAAFMADSQVPWGLEVLSGKISEPAWKSKPSWYLIATEDKMIPPDAQRAMSKPAGATIFRLNVKAKGVSGDGLFCARHYCFTHSLKERHRWRVPAHCISIFIDPLVFCINLLTDPYELGHIRF